MVLYTHAIIQYEVKKITFLMCEKTNKNYNFQNAYECNKFIWINTNVFFLTSTIRVNI